MTATSALRKYWTNKKLSGSVTETGRILSERLRQVAQGSRDFSLSVRGRGMMLGLDCGMGKLAEKIVRKAFQDGLVVERCGAEGQVIKVLPPLTIDRQTLQRGLDILDKSVHASAYRSCRPPSLGIPGWRS
ncbi:aminotransferase class III-fold pyridoxal phosphate-dependent enzyme [Mesorhizobium sp. M0998]